jgi:hypothetical protein
MGEAPVDSRGTARGELLTMRGWSAVPLGVFLVMHGGSNDERGQKRRQKWMRKGWRCLGGADSQRRGKCMAGRSVAPLGQCGERGKGGRGSSSRGTVWRERGRPVHVARRKTGPGGRLTAARSRQGWTTHGARSCAAWGKTGEGRCR